MSAHPRAAQEAPDTPRRHIDTLARRALGLPNLSTDELTDELMQVSAITDRAAAVRAFDELCGHMADGHHDAAETVLDLLTGELR